MAENEVFFTGCSTDAICVICGAEFQNSERPRSVCSENCKRERSRRYGAKYRQDTRDLRTKIHSMFGGKAPTREQLLDLIKSRKGKS